MGHSIKVEVFHDSGSYRRAGMCRMLRYYIGNGVGMMVRLLN